MATIIKTQRNVALSTLIRRLKNDRQRQVDVVVHRDAVDFENGHLLVSPSEGTPPMVIEPGFHLMGNLATKLEIPVAWGRYLWDQINTPMPPDMDEIETMEWEMKVRQYEMTFDQTFATQKAYEGPERYLIRTYKQPGEGDRYYGRAFLSDRFRIINNVDVLGTVLEAINEIGVKVEDVGCDWNDYKMRVRLATPEVTAAAEAFLDGYVSPWRRGKERSKLIQAGIEITNGEVGGVAFAITPRMMVEACDNGLVIKRDMVRSVHLGGRLEDGQVEWSEETQRANLELIKSKTKDAVRRFLDPGYLVSQVEALTAKAGKPLDKPTEVLKVIAKRQTWSDEELDGILDLFMKSKQVTSGGVMQAVTAYVQEVPDQERAGVLEALAPEAMNLAYSLA